MVRVFENLKARESESLIWDSEGLRVGASAREYGPRTLWFGTNGAANGTPVLCRLAESPRERGSRTLSIGTAGVANSALVLCRLAQSAPRMRPPDWRLFTQ